MSYFPHAVKSAVADASLVFNHTCLRIKDPQRSIKFYTECFGMKLIKKMDVPMGKFTNYFLAFQEGSVFDRAGVLELTHNWVTETDPGYKINNGNEEPHRGFGHIAFAIDNIEDACAKLESLNVNFKKRLVDGKMKDIAFALDPDNYWIEIISSNKNKDYKFNHTMLRVKDATKSLEFYQNVLGMKLIQKTVHENGKFTLYFLGYQDPKSVDHKNNQEGLLELTHNWGTESDESFHYHNGNEQPQGYGHICVSTKDPEALCNDIDSVYKDKVTWGVKWNQGKMKNLAFIKDPDNYSIEILPHSMAL
ncbi:hypothetical protein KAFR_0A06710 [Kazachstania africana CBS 2517]|uniref:Lactoylglutathione lyase n=1 Tax=Kazachstania africana (strain ATCC 22294 / BCRC 22015 / CBS 2517 / CECT 1963 / NBRC 1671 / NRRL Y-8276) TaxID=1071382 RepID=H2AP06_KAZAF|nr:hypothetical protein KAFR_0A06710 [Kazachstania africana CBS 2517]CCF56106.1 hypothetical protein KAFR_0A06710 [Kazachstania africana CBS 2517]